MLKMSARLDDHLASSAEEIQGKISQLAENASQEDHRRVDELIAKAIAASKPFIDMIEYTPGMSALLITSHNNFNRYWAAQHSYALAVVMLNGEWRATGQGYAFYQDNGDLADGAHRLAAQAYSGTTLLMPTYFGMNKADAGTLDCGKRRTAGDAATLAGVANGKLKEEVLRAIAGYLKGAKLGVLVNTSNVVALAKQIQRDDALLSRAIEIGESSIIDCIGPLLSDKEANKVAGILLHSSWPESSVCAGLEKLQQADFDNDKDPLWKARAYIEAHLPQGDEIRPTEIQRLVIKALLFSEMGTLINPRREKELMNAIAHPEDPRYPRAGFSTAAE
jgi:hypothetical protein